MRIAMVSEHASPLATLGGVDAGGQNVHVAALSIALADRGHEVVVYTRRDARDQPLRRQLAPGVTVHHIDAGPARALPKDDLVEFMPAFGRALAAHWRHHRPDVVHSHFWMSGLATYGAALEHGVPHLHTFHALGATKRRHQGDADPSPPQRLDIERALARRTHVVATSREEVDELVAMGARPTRVTQIPCGVDLDRFTPAPAPTRHPAGHGTVRILAVSRMVERKGIGDVVAALADIPRAQLVVAGGPDRTAIDGDPEIRRLCELADEVGVAERVRFLGRVGRTGLPSLYRSADLVVCTPWYEPFGLVALEAAACGVPVVASAVGGLRDTVVDGVTGTLVPPRDPAALAASVNRLIYDPAARRALGRAGARRAAARYGWPVIASETLGAYRQASQSHSLEVVSIG